jgi:multicomponent Na+:H+ antiporter subunit E
MRQLWLLSLTLRYDFGPTSMNGKYMRAVGILSGVLLLFAVWVLWGGLLKTPVLELGIASSILVAWLSMRMDLPRPYLYTLNLAYRLPRYWLWLLVQMVISNVQVLRLVLGPKSALDTTLIDIQALPRGNFGRALLGNTITLTPGTLTIAIEAKTITVHCLTKANALDLAEGAMNRRVAEVVAR